MHFFVEITYAQLGHNAHKYLGPLANSFNSFDMTTKSINTLSLYRPSIRALYKRSPTNWDIATWVNLVGRHINFVDHDDIYEPIELRIKVAGRLGSAQGLVTMQVSERTSFLAQTNVCAGRPYRRLVVSDAPFRTGPRHEDCQTRHSIHVIAHDAR